MSAGNSPFPLGDHKGVGFSIATLINVVQNATLSVKAKLSLIQAARSQVSIADMFDMQMLMNRLSQMSEMSSSVVSASNTAIMSMARGVKG